MVLGERIKRIRTFRGLTQRELGLKLGYEERNADVRIAQYESGYRVPKNNTLNGNGKDIERQLYSFYWCYTRLRRRYYAYIPLA